MKTDFLKLALADPSRSFMSWQDDMNGTLDDGTPSNMHIIDEFAKAVYGISGIVTLSANGWDTETKAYTLTVDQLGTDDAIFLTPATVSDKANIDSVSVFISSNGKTVTFTATETPAADITLNYFISRGRA